MSTAETETAAAAPRFCGDCGQELTEPMPLAQCFECMPQDTATALAAAHHRMALALTNAR